METTPHYRNKPTQKIQMQTKCTKIYIYILQEIKKNQNAMATSTNILMKNKISNVLCIIVLFSFTYTEGISIEATDESPLVRPSLLQNIASNGGLGSLLPHL